MGVARGSVDHPNSSGSSRGSSAACSSARSAALDRTKPPLQFRTATTIHSVDINASGNALAVGTSEHTEIYRVIVKELDDGTSRTICEPLQVLDCAATQVA